MRSHAQKVLPDYSIAARQGQQANSSQAGPQSFSSKKSDKDTHEAAPLPQPDEDSSTSLLGKRTVHQREDSAVSGHLSHKRQRVDSSDHFQPAGYQLVPSAAPSVST